MWPTTISRSKYDTLNSHLRSVHDLGQFGVGLVSVAVIRNAAGKNATWECKSVLINNKECNVPIVLGDYQTLIREAARKECTLERRVEIRSELSAIRASKRKIT